MKLFDLVKVMEESSFIAVEFKGEVVYSGSARNFKGNHYTASKVVENIMPARNEKSATIITLK